MQSEEIMEFSDDRITRVIQCPQESHYHIRREIERRMISRRVHVERVNVKRVRVECEG